MTPYRFSPEWKGETAFIVAGGPSVLSQPVERLRGRKVIAVKSSYTAVPFAQYLLFSDARWWTEHKARARFEGKIVEVGSSHNDARLLHVKRRKPPGLSDDAGALTVNWTIVSAAIDAAVFLGCARIVFLGLDHKRGADGRSHHHEPHKWAWRGDTLFDKQRADLESMAGPLKAKNIEVINCSPGSALKLWPVMPLNECLDGLVDLDRIRAA